MSNRLNRLENLTYWKHTQHFSFFLPRTIFAKLLNIDLIFFFFWSPDIHVYFYYVFILWSDDMKKVPKLQLYHHQNPTGSMSSRSLSAFRQWQCLCAWCEPSVFTYVRVKLAVLSVLQGVDWITAAGRGAEADGASVGNEAVYSQWCQHPHDQPQLIQPSPQGSFFTRLHQLSANPG